MQSVPRLFAMLLAIKGGLAGWEDGSPSPQGAISRVQSRNAHIHLSLPQSADLGPLWMAAQSHCHHRNTYTALRDTSRRFDLGFSA